MPALLKSGRRSLSPSSMAKSGAASALHLQPRANVNSDTMSPKAAMTTVIQVCTVRPRNVICARSTPIDSSFLRHLRRLVFVRFPAYASGGRNLFPTVRPMEVAVDSRIRVTSESAEYFRVRLLGFYGPHAHLDVIITAADLRQWRDKIDEALQEVDNVGV